ncbi:MAG: GNAT family N-acetyltransferase, partial [Nitrososphaerales archaeon]
QGRLWLWETDRPVAMAGAPEAANGVARLGWVYTPREHRRRGFAGAVTAALSGQLLAHEADTCVLYTQLSNPTSNAIYLRLGYRPVSETLTYRFGETL